MDVNFVFLHEMNTVNVLQDKLNFLMIHWQVLSCKHFEKDSDNKYYVPCSK